MAALPRLLSEWLTDSYVRCPFTAVGKVVHLAKYLAVL